MKRTLFIWLLCGCMLLSACQRSRVLPTMEAHPEHTQTVPLAAVALPAAEPSAVEDMFTDRDLDDSCADFVTITLSDGASKADGNGVDVNGDVVTITKAGTYLITGKLTDGQLTANLGENDKVQIVLSNANIANTATAALYIPKADKVFITLASGTHNSLTSFIADETAKIDGALFAKCDLTLNGTGTLTASCDNSHGIVCKKDLKITGGEYMVTAAKKGISAENSVRIADGIFAITSGTDGIHAEHDTNAEKGFVYLCGGNFTIRAEGDGISAGSALTILDGSFDIVSGGGVENAARGNEKINRWDGGHGQFDGMSRPFKGAHGDRHPDGQIENMRPMESPQEDMRVEQNTSGSPSAKGMKAEGGVRIMGGNITLDTAGDGIHSGNYVDISNGEIIVSAGDDGIHADSIANITGGTVLVTRSYEGIEGQNVVISGGVVSVTTRDDGINAAGGDGSGFGNGDKFRESVGTIQISGGSVSVDAEGDGLDANGALYISGGDIQVNGTSVGGNGAIDFDTGATISGGTLVAVSNGRMEQNFGQDSTQGAILIALTEEQKAGTEIILLDATDREILRFAAAKVFSAVNLSSPEIRAGETYTLQVGTETQSISMTDLIYGTGTGFGGGHGDRGGF